MTHDESPEPAPPRSNRGAKLLVAGLFLCVCIASLAYRLLVLGRLEQTSAMFIGLPTLLGIGIATVLPLGPGARKNPMGVALSVTTLALLLSCVILGEGTICVLMMAPLAYGVVALVVAAFGAIKKRTRWRSVIVLPLGLMSVEGVSEDLSFDREARVLVEAHTELSADEVRERLAATPTFEGELPTFLQLGFPAPTRTRGSGLNIGDRRIIHFAGGEGEPGDLILQVSESEAGHVQFSLVEDHSHIAHWLRWNTVDVHFEDTNDGGCDVRWDARFTRRLDPAWYFDYWERRGVEAAMAYLHDELLRR